MNIGREMSLETFQAIMRTNVEAPMLRQAAAPHMAAAGWAGSSILRLSAHRGVTGRVHVAASKWPWSG